MPGERSQLSSKYKPKTAGRDVSRMTFCLMPNEICAQSRDVQFSQNDSLPGSHLTASQTAGQRIKNQQHKQDQPTLSSTTKVALRPVVSQTM